MDMDTVCEFNQIDKIETNILAENSTQSLHPTKFTKEKLQNLNKIDIDEIFGGESEVIDLKDNYLPIGLTPLEDFFDSNDIPRKPKIQPLNADIEDCNIGTEQNPKMINCPKLCLLIKSLNMLNCSSNSRTFLHGAMKISNLMILLCFNIQYPLKKIKNHSNKNLEGSILYYSL